MLTLASLSAGGAFAAKKEAVEAEPPPPRTSDYRIGIEDVLQISVWGEPQLTRTVRVRPDGKITIPLVNDLDVNGMTPDEVRHVIAERLSKYVHEPNVPVIVEEINSFRVYVLGEVNQQGVLTFTRPTRLLQALAAAGGLTQFSKKRITLIRDVGGVEKRVLLNYKSLLSGDAPGKNVFLKPGDTILVE